MTILNNGANTLKIMSNQKKYKRNLIEQKDGIILAPPDTTLLVVVGFLVVIGLMAIFSASSEKSIIMGANPASFMFKQLAFAVAGFFCMRKLARIDYKRLAKYSIQFSWVVVGLLVVVAFMGVNVNEATRWIAIGPIQFQPSELAKPAFVLSLASAFKNDSVILDKNKLPYYIPLAIMVLLIFKQPNLSMVMLLSATALVIYLCAGGNWKNLLFIAGMGLFVISKKLHGYQLTRLKTWLDPASDPQGAGYNILQSLYAISSGGFWGMGFGQSRQKFGWLPECHTDFIYSIIAEELGFFGCVLIIGLFWTLIQRGITISSRCPDRFGKLVAVGLTFSIGIQAMLNMSVASSFLPATGITLPFVSYGGSSLLSYLLIIGIVFKISSNSRKTIN